MGCQNAKATQTSSPTRENNHSPKNRPDTSAKGRKGPDDQRSSGGPESSKSNGDKQVWIVMGKYKMNMSKEDVVGEGTSSICRKAANIQTGEMVAVKVYKAHKENSKHEDVKLQKFRRQISVLKELQEPFQVPSDPALWSDQLSRAKPSRLFMQLIDYSKNNSGEPAPDPTDGILYVVTELAQYSLKDYLALRRDQCRPLPKESVRNITKAIVLVMAGLHAKGLVHIDLKPENLMMFNGRLKLIDVDGCVKAGTHVSIQDSSISFSPCYCAPEWAKFLIEDSESRILVSPALDVWSVGMTICELVTLDAILKPMYANFLRNGHSHREAGFLFMDWLSSIKKAPIPKSVEKFDADFTDVLVNWLLVCDPAKRKTCAQSLANPYIATITGSEIRKSTTRSSTHDGENHLKVDETVVRTVRQPRVEDNSSKAPLFKGTLWKLNSNGNAKDTTHWLKRDMWIASNGSLAYFSIKENKRLVLIDGAKLPGAGISKFEDGCKENSFQIKTRCDDQDGEVAFVFAVDTPEEYKEWTTKLRSVSNMDDMMQTMNLGEKMAQELSAYKLNVQNRRMKVDADDKTNFEPVFRGKLWKVKAEGDRMRKEDWFEREMWIAKNGSLVYWSKKEERELVYYNSDDISRADFKEIANSQSFQPWAFQVQLPASHDVEFVPGEFAAESEAMRRTWIQEMRKVQSHSH